MNRTELKNLTNQVINKRSIWLFLDYDGTLAEFAPTPEIIDPNPRLSKLLSQLAAKPNVRLSVISGRRLRDIQALIPVKGITIAGTYGVELHTPDGKVIHRVQYDTIRPYLEKVKPKWVEIIGSESGFYLEDKDWALALHAKSSEDADATRVLALAREVVEQSLPEEKFRILGGHKFLEVAPLLAHKGKTVSYLISKSPLANAQLIYIGDDDKDEEAFRVIQEAGGIAIKVVGGISPAQPTRAHYTLDSPASVNAWLETLVTFAPTS